MRRTQAHNPEVSNQNSKFLNDSGFGRKIWESDSPIIPHSTNKSLNDLTAQEINIAVLVSQGKTNTEIGAALFIASGTVRNYVSSILSKLYLPNRAALAVYAVQNDLRGQSVKDYQEGPVTYNPDCYKDLLTMAIM